MACVTQSFWYKRLLLKERDLMIRYTRGEREKGTAADWNKLQMLLMQVRLSRFLGEAWRVTTRVISLPMSHL